jgi:hypothetical protein
MIPAHPVLREQDWPSVVNKYRDGRTRQQGQTQRKSEEGNDAFQGRAKA